MTATSPVTTAPARAGAILTALVLTAVVCNLNIAGATVALPGIAVAFDASQTALNLVGVGAGLGLSMSVLYSGAIADRFGRKQVLLIGLALTIIASVVSAFSPSVEFLVGARIFTGLAAGMAYPTTLSLITALWADGPKRTGAIAIWSGVGGMASVIGGILAGLVLLWFWWGSVFFVCVPVALVALVLVVRFVPSHVGESSEPVDHLGGVLSVLGIASLVLGVSNVFAPGGLELGLGLLGGAVVLLGLFVWRQSTARSPLFELRIASRRLFWVPALTGGIVFGGLIGAMFVGEQFMQNILGYSALGAGLAVIPAAVGLVIVAPIAARVVLRHGTRFTMLLGYSGVIIGFVTMLFWREDTSYLLVGVGFLAIGAGAALVITSSSRSLTRSTPVQRVGMASATSDLQSDLGGSVLQSVLGAILAAGFAQFFATLIAESPQAQGLGDTVTRALQASFASAMQVAQQYPEYADAIDEAARQSMVAGALGAYLVGGIVVVIGALLALFALPSRAREAELAEQYVAEDRERASRV